MNTLQITVEGNVDKQRLSHEDIMVDCTVEPL
jgi:hypothetical protein